MLARTQLCTRLLPRDPRVWKLEAKVYSFLLIGRIRGCSGNFRRVAGGLHGDGIRIQVVRGPGGSLGPAHAASCLGLSFNP